MPAGEQKTEQPTQRRREQSRKEGRFPASREFVAGIQFATFVLLLQNYGHTWLESTVETVRTLLRRAMDGRNLGADEVVLLLHHGAPLLWGLIAAGGVLMLSTFGIHLATTQFGFALNKVAPDFKRLNPAPKLKQLPSQNLSTFFRAMIALPVLLYVAYVAASEKMPLFLQMPQMSVEGGFLRLSSAVLDLLWKAALIFFGLGALDLFRERRKFMNELRMTKQEIREEMKESEGNPQVKAQIRRLRRNLLRRKMMSEVATATAIIVNPTHYAVAIKYDVGQMAAPKVVAKGKNYLALRIRARAMEHQVPIIENRPLAQALYKSVDVGQEIPAHLYRAVAEILAYLYKLMGGRLRGGEG
jgi:flagellar biosynthesis protein FlhB